VTSSVTRRISVEIVGDADSIEKAFRTTSTSGARLSGDLEKYARAAIVSNSKQRESQRLLLDEYVKVANGAKKGSEEQRAAHQMAEKSAKQLGLTFEHTGGQARVMERDLGRAGKGAIGAGLGFKGLGRNVAFASAQFLGAAGFVEVVKTSINAVGSLEEQLTRTDKVFKTSSGEVKAWSQNSAEALGLSRSAALAAANTVGTLLTNVGKTPAQAAGMSKSLVQLAVDVGAFNKVSSATALTAFQSALAGRLLGLKRMGIVIDANAVKEEAYRSGIAQTTVVSAKVADATTKLEIARAKLAAAEAKYGAGTTQVAQATVALHNAETSLTKARAGSAVQLTAQQKELATFNLLLQKGKFAQGAFAASSNELSVIEQKLHANLVGVEVQIGQALLPTVEKYGAELDKWLAKEQKSGAIQRDVEKAVHLVTAAISAGIPVVKVIAGQFNALSDAVGGDQHAIELLIGAWIAYKSTTKALALYALAQDVGLVGAAATAAGLEVSALRTALLALSRMAPIVIGVEVAIHRASIQDWLKKNIPGGKVIGSSLFMYDTIWKELNQPGKDAYVNAPGYGVGASAGGAGSEAAAKAAHGVGATNAGMSTGKQKMLALAQQALGTPYLWGGNAPGGFDCSGLVQWAFANGLNVNIPHSTYEQVKMGSAVSASKAKVGNVVFTNYGENGNPGPGHEGLIVGFDKKGEPIVESAPHSGTKVHTSSLSAFVGGGQYQIRDLLAQATNSPGTTAAGGAGGNPLVVGHAPHKPTTVSGDSLFSTALGDQVSRLRDKAKNAAASGDNSLAADYLKQEEAALEQAKQQVAKLKGKGTAKQQAAVAREVTSLQNRLDDVKTKLAGSLAATVPAGLADQISRAADQARNAGKTAGDDSLAVSYLKSEAKLLEKAQAAIRSQIKKEGLDPKKSAAANKELTKLKNQHADVQTSIQVLADKAFAASLLTEQTGFAAKMQPSTVAYSAEIKREYYLTGKALQASYVTVAGNLSTQRATIITEISKLQAGMVGKDAKQRALIQATISKLKTSLSNVDSEVASNLDNEYQALTSSLSTLQSTVSTKWGTYAAEIQSAFSAQTQKLLDQLTKNPSYFQNGALTPSEKQMQGMQSQDTVDGLNKTLDDAKAQLQNDMAAAASAVSDGATAVAGAATDTVTNVAQLADGITLISTSTAQAAQAAQTATATADQSTIDADNAAVAAAQRQLDEYDLGIKAQQERVDADTAYAAAVQTVTDQRTLQETELSKVLDEFGAGLAAGTLSISDLQGWLNGANPQGWQFGLNLDTLNAFSPLVASDFKDLVGSSAALKQAFADLAQWIAAHTGNAAGFTTDVTAGGWTGPVDTNGVPAAAGFYGFDNQGNWVGGDINSISLPHLAAGGVVTKPTVAVIGEAGHEAVIPLDRLMGTSTSPGGGHQTIVIEVDGRELARAAAPYTDGLVRVKLR